MTYIRAIFSFIWIFCCLQTQTLCASQENWFALITQLRAEMPKMGENVELSQSLEKGAFPSDQNQHCTQPEHKIHPDISRIYLGASNVNYHIRMNDSDLFVRLAPLTGQALYANPQIEFDVLQALEPMRICAKPFFYDKNQRAIVTEFIPHHDGDVDLLDAKVQKAVCAMLKEIENAGIEINRTFHPYQDILEMVNQEHILCEERLSDEFYESFLPALQRIDQALALYPRKMLCHLDLHHKNILEDDERLWLIDWEYAAMSHPYLTLASMASIERWSDEQMFSLLSVYTPNATDEDRQILYLYRIVADLFWTVWNHVQNSCSSIRNPYSEWEELFYKEAKARLSTSKWEEAVGGMEL